MKLIGLVRGRVTGMPNEMKLTQYEMKRVTCKRHLGSVSLKCGIPLGLNTTIIASHQLLSILIFFIKIKMKALRLHANHTSVSSRDKFWGTLLL